MGIDGATLESLDETLFEALGVEVKDQAIILEKLAELTKMQGQPPGEIQIDSQDQINQKIKHAALVAEKRKELEAKLRKKMEWLSFFTNINFEKSEIWKFSKLCQASFF